MKDKARAMVLGSFVADSLALGAHWIYDTNQIDRDIGTVDRLIKPQPGSYHETKGLGDFTHYGDQTLCLLESLSAEKGFNLHHFAQSWRELFNGYTGYFDHATKETIGNFESGNTPEISGSESSELGGTSRIAPLVYYYRDDVESLITHAKAQTIMTHNHPHVAVSAAFLAELTTGVLAGNNPSTVVGDLASSKYSESPVSKWVMDGINSAKRDTRQVISDFGQHCDVSAAFPSVIHLIVKYENDFKEGLVQNVMAGGDSAARGLVAGMILGAYQGMDALPKDWLSKLAKRSRIEALMG